MSCFDSVCAVSVCTGYNNTCVLIAKLPTAHRLHVQLKDVCTAYYELRGIQSTGNLTNGVHWDLT